MAVATTTATLIAAGIAAGGTAAAARSQANSANRALDAQERANREAMELERTHADARKASQQERENARQLRFMNYYNRYGDAAIDRYGIPPGIDPGLLPPRPTDRPARPAGGTTAPLTTPAPQGLGALGGRPGLMDSQQPGTNPSVMPNQAQNPRQGTLGALGGWEDWNLYGVR